MENQDFKHIMWPSIEGFQHVYKNVKTYPDHYPQPDPDCSIIQYVPKVKLHGTNAAIQCKNGKVVAQSRETLLVNGADNSGFAKWVESTKEYWKRFENICFFGEWCGPGIQSGVAVNQIPNKIFAVFSALDIGTNNLIIYPFDLRVLIGEIPDVHVLPWADFDITIDWKNDSDEALQKTADCINKKVEEIEACDPWVKKTFGIEGVGEGLVFYPHVDGVENYEMYETLFFKAKGEKHRVIKTKSAATVNPETAANAAAFVDMVLPEARLLQGVEKAAPGFDKKLTGAFVGWVLADVRKEAQDELEASGLTWNDVQKSLTDKARKWYLDKC